MTLALYNTLTRKKEIFTPLAAGRVGLYTCGPTVYNHQHLGNYRTYIFEDVLRRVLTRAGYEVRHVMNITDVGHLTSDADTGEDKLERGAAREGKTVWDVARFYTDAFLADIAKLNILRADELVPATSRIPAQIAIIEELFKKGYAYETSQAIYFDVSKFPDYTKLSRQKLEDKKTAVRGEVVEDPEKRHPADFALWFKLAGRYKDHVMRWPSPWGEGFPGWHIECSAISTAHLGQPFDIHTGGVDHITVHHTNEIAQSEAAYGTPLARYWMHGEFLLIDEKKMAKSAGNFHTLATLEEKGHSPLAFRYLVLTAHYRSQMNFTWESLAAADAALNRLYDFVRTLRENQVSQIPGRASKNQGLEKYVQGFDEAIADDLNTPKALAVLWDLVGAYYKNPDQYDAKDILALLYDWDTVLGLGLKDVSAQAIPPEVGQLATEREQARRDKDWKKSDELRKKIISLGYIVKDTPAGTEIKKQ